MSFFPSLGNISVCQSTSFIDRLQKHIKNCDRVGLQGLNG